MVMDHDKLVGMSRKASQCTDDSIALFDYTYNQSAIWVTNGTAAPIKIQSHNKCLTAKGASLDFQSCSGVDNQRFTITRGGDFSVLQKPVVSAFKWDGANSLSCCKNGKGSCCDWRMRFDLSEADYKAAIAKIH
jgi:hypothetical protein